MRPVTLLSVAITSALIFGTPSPADAGWIKDRVKEATGAVNKAVHVAAAPLKVVAEGAKATGEMVVDGAQQVGHQLERAGKEAGRSVENVGEVVAAGAEHVGEQAERVGKEVVREAKDVGEAFEQTGKFAENQVRDMRDQVMALESNIRNGEFERVLGFSFYTMRNTSENAATAMQNSVVLHVVGQMAASTVPGGTGVFAAWHAAEAGADIEDVIKAGAVTGLTAYAVTSIQAPSIEVGADGVVTPVPRALDAVSIAERAAATGTVGATAAAVAGGNSHDVEKAFALGAATSVAADAYLAVTAADVDARPSSKPPYCKLGGPGADCSPPAEAWRQDPETGEWTVDIKQTDPQAHQVGTQASYADVRPYYAANKGFDWWDLQSEASPWMYGASKIHGTNAGAFFHDELADIWSLEGFLLKATIPPAMIMTSVATGAPLFIHLESTASDTSNE